MLQDRLRPNCCGSRTACVAVTRHRVATVLTRTARCSA